MQRIRDILDYHSSVEQAAATAARAGVGTSCSPTTCRASRPGQEDDWRALAAGSSTGRSSWATTCTGSRFTPECARKR